MKNQEWNERIFRFKNGTEIELVRHPQAVGGWVAMLTKPGMKNAPAVGTGLTARAAIQNIRKRSAKEFMKRVCGEKAIRPTPTPQKGRDLYAARIVKSLGKASHVLGFLAIAIFLNGCAYSPLCQHWDGSIRPDAADTRAYWENQQKDIQARQEAIFKKHPEWRNATAGTVLKTTTFDRNGAKIGSSITTE